MEFDKDEEEEDEDRGDDEDIEDDSDLDLARVISQSQLPLDLDWEPEVCYNNADFQSLRFTCKELYQKTEYDAAVRYSHLLKPLELSLERSSFLRFLQISSVPSFRDRIGTVCLYNPPDFEYGSDRDFVYKLAQRLNDDALRRIRAKVREFEEFQASDEAVDILSKCLRHLDTAKVLQRIELIGERGHDLVLRAISLGLATRRVAYLAIDLNRLAGIGYGSLTDTPQAYAPYVKGLQIEPSLSTHHGRTRTQSIKRGEDNFRGLHIRNFHPTTKKFTAFMASFINVEALDIWGCRVSPELRLCHGCDDLFAKTFAPGFYPNLSELSVTTILISGSRLRRFIKRHADTLSKVSMSYVTLTDGSWQSIAQGLVKLPNLRELFLESLRQKGSKKTVGRPSQYRNASNIRLQTRGHIQEFLKNFVAFFSTVQYLNPERFRKSPPRYHEAKLFTLPNVGALSNELRDGDGLARTFKGL